MASYFYVNKNLEKLILPEKQASIFDNKDDSPSGRNALSK
jgi:hypothetical protein